MLVAQVSTLEPESANGVNQTIRGLLRYLPNEGVNVERWYFTPQARNIAQRQVQGVTVVDLPCHRQGWMDLWSLPRETARYLRCRAADVSLVHLHSVFSSQNLSAARLCRRYVVTTHGGYGSLGRLGNRLAKRLWLSLWERPYLRKAAAVHLVSPGEIEQIRSVSNQLMTVSIPNGVDEELTRMVAAEPAECGPWVFVGRLAIDHKGLDLLLHAYAILRRLSGTPPPPLILAGMDHRAGRGQLEKLADSLGIGQMVEFREPVFGQEKWELLKKARLFIHTSRWEGLPFAVLEAMGLGRPVLITPETNLGDKVREYRAGWVAQGIAAGIAQAMRKALECPGPQLNAAGAAGRRAVKECFIWPLIARQMAEVYRAVGVNGRAGWKGMEGDGKG